ncbi:MAG: tRNA (cytidine(34)-2'-O)-methyltransferase [Firmicutes bacterium]|nr:tRNA (cytidine(34)-2'-O)-methyltransferase [Bacillota bacterium]
MHIALIEPEIPPNTGNITRTCVMTGTTLHLVGKLGFSLADRHLRRAGLDYWPYLVFYTYRDFESLYRFYQHNGCNFYFFTTKAQKAYTEATYKIDDFLVFGRETAGLSPEFLARWPERCLRIPMKAGLPRSLNLSNAVAIVLYEALRQQGYPGLQ